MGLQTREPAASACCSTLLAETIIVIVIVISLLDFLLFCRQAAESGREEGRAWWHTLCSSAHPGGPRYAPSASPLFRFALQSQHFFKQSSLVPLGLQLPGLFSGSRDPPAGLGSACGSLRQPSSPPGRRDPEAASASPGNTKGALPASRCGGISWWPLEAVPTSKSPEPVTVIGKGSLQT